MLAIAAALVLQTAQVAPALVPGTTYDPNVPTLEQVVGHGPMNEITAPDEMVRYFEALAAAAPDRTRYVEYGRTWEGRPLTMLVIGSPERIANLDALKTDLQRLADPRGLAVAEADALVADLPVVVALVYGVHGNEISSGGAALALAYHLLAAQNDPVADAAFRDGLVLIDPAQNPDGRARFVHSTRQARGLVPSGYPSSAEHDEPWPGGRVNHYLFDLNRDWFAQTQPESQGRVAALREYMPHVVADVHEMGGNSTYYFPPNAVPGNPWTTPEQTASLQRLGASMAADFDARGFRYFNRDTYDAFYPGYGVSWPMAQGAVGMTFEQASARGLVLDRADGGTLTYGDGVLHHFTATRATLRRSLEDRERILHEFLAFRRSAVALGEGRAYVLHSAHDPAMATRLAHTLAQNGIDVRTPDAPITVGARTLPVTGTFVVPLGQPSHRLIRNLLDRHTAMDTTFVAEQIRRRGLRLRDQIYDVTSWSLPLLWDVEVLETRTVPASSTMSGHGTLRAPPPPADTEVVAWLMPWGTGTAAAVVELLRDGATIRATGAALTLEGRTWPVGTAVVRPSENGDGTGARVLAAATRHGVNAVAVRTAYSDAGSSFGSNATRSLRIPRIALAWDQPGSTYSVGWARYVLERRFGLPVTAIRGDALASTTLSDFDVIVLPSGNYGSVFGGEATALRQWLAQGGTLVTLAESARWAARAGILATTTELRGGAPEFGEAARPGAGAAEQPIDPVASITPERESPEPTPGAILNVDLDTSHWLAAGTDGRIGALVEGSRVFSPLKLDRGVNVGRYASPEDLVASGIVWEEARPQLSYKAFLMHQPVGAGQVVAFAEDPNYRSYAEATQLLFLNAILLGAGR